MRAFRPRRVLLACAAAGLFAPAAHAGHIPPLVPDADVPDVVLQRADWASRAPQSLEEVLRTVAGIAIARSGGSGSAEMISVLGSTNGRVQICVDGIEITSPELEWPRLHAVPLGMVERIEIFRQREPARIAIWTRESTSNAASADFDVGRGGVDSRIRRVQLLTPPRAVEVAVAYDEVLRGDEDFRTVTVPPPAVLLGSWNQRTQLVRIDLRRGDNVVRLTHLNDNSNAHGSVQNDADVWRTDAFRTNLRWDRTQGAARWALVVAHHAWDHQRTIAGSAGTLREGRTTAALDLGRPGAWPVWLRLRASDASGDGRATGDTDAHGRFARFVGEVEAGHRGRIDLTAHAGWMNDERALAELTGGVRAARRAGGWELALAAGRGASYAGYGAAVGEPRRRGEYASASLGRTSGEITWRLEAFAKQLRDRSRATGAFFPNSGAGPERLAGGLVVARWAHAGPRWRWSAQATGAWTPDATGDRAGLAEHQAIARADLGATFRSGDLTIDAWSDWTVDDERRWGTTALLAPAARGSVGLDVAFLARLHFFWNIDNVADVEIESFPGVRLPARTSFFGVRVRLID